MYKYLLCYASLFLLPLHAYSSIDNLHFITEEYPPYNYQENGKLQGIAVNLLEQAFIADGDFLLDRSAIDTLPWSRGYETVLNTPNSVLFSTTRTDSREASFHWVGPISDNRVVLMARKSDAISIGSIESINQSDLKIAVIRDDIGAERLQELGVAPARIQTAISNASALAMLNADRVDLWAYGEDVAYALMDSLGYDKDNFEPVYTLSEANLYYAVNIDTDEQTVEKLKNAVNQAKAQSRLLKFVTEEYPPYNYLDEKGMIRGISTELLEELLERSVLNAEFQLLPWARAITEAEMRENTCVYSTTRTPAREEKFKWIGPLKNNQWGAFSLSTSSINSKSLEELNDLRVGSFRESGIAKYVQDKGLSLILATTDSDNVDRLSNDLVDVWVTSVAAAEFLAEQKGVTLKQLFVFNELPLYLACNNEFPAELQQRLQTTLELIQKEQTSSSNLTDRSDDIE